MRRLFKLTALAGAITLLSAMCSIAAPPKYIIQDLGTLRGDYSEASNVNNFGQVCGSISDGISVHAIFLSDGVFTEIPTLGGPSSRGQGMNDSGVVVGIADITYYTSHGFIYDHGNFQGLGTPAGGYDWCLLFSHSSR